MKKRCAEFFLAALLVLTVQVSFGQDKLVAQPEFKNAPVRFKENNQSCQQVILSYKAEQQGTILVTYNGKEVVKADLKKGKNSFLITLPAVQKERKVTFSTIINGTAPVKTGFVVKPPKKWDIYLVQHSHTDIGYTRPQSEILAEHQRYIDYALDYCDMTDHFPDDSKFRWTCESAWVVKEYLKTRPSSQIERLKKRVAEGRIEITGMFCNMAETADENLMTDFLRPLQIIQEAGFPVKTVMQNDVNGIAWCMPDLFKNTGVKYLNMGINETRSILPFDLPTLFWWKAPSGEKLLAFRADHYMTGNFFGIESKAIKAENLLGHLADLEAKKYPFDKIAIQFSGYFTDNAPPSTAACQLVKEWNEKYEFPKLKLSVASEFFGYVEKNYADRLPVYQKAWLDWWTDGLGSASRETAEVRKTQNLKQVDEGLFAMVAMNGGELNPGLQSEIDHIAENAIFYDEHTFGADESISHPYSENTAHQWLQKGAYAWEAVKMQTLLHEEALARYQPFLKKSDFPVIHVINSMGWKRSGSVKLFVDFEVLPILKTVRVIDLSTGLEVPAQMLQKRAEGAYWELEVSDIPALGVKTLKIEVTDQSAEKPVAGTQVEELQNKYYKLIIDKTNGGISSLFDKELQRELTDPANPWKIGQAIHETMPKRDKYEPSHTSVTNVTVEKGENGKVWESIKISADIAGTEKGTDKSPKGLEMEVRLYKNTKKIELRYTAHKQIITDPEALYVAFPFALPDSRIVFETIGGTLTQGDQLPGSSSDWNVAQNFVAVRGKTGQIVVVSDEIPLWQFSDFNMGKFERYPKQGKTWLYSWVMNNYWFTNFRAYQEAGFSWSYQLTSSRDTSNTFAAKFGWGERNKFPTRTFPAGKPELKQYMSESLKI
ncbi:MAG TPA: glycoside hydrolase family 38 C-terminal domain-containing protein, partial [Prolixibacteraceae bacterium]|nr:glycoside hydrolase family 38 C-terminal domain-containing protein [Prolixibacteraceae bacterium]